MLFNKVLVTYWYRYCANHEWHEATRSFVTPFNKTISQEEDVEELLGLATQHLLNKVSGTIDIDEILVQIVNFKRLETPE